MRRPRRAGVALAVLITLHGLLHLPRAVKAFGWADVGQLHASISGPAGVLWLVAGAVLLVAGTGVALGARWWWYAALPGVLLSQSLIVSTWSDASLGTIANVIIAVPLLLAALDTRPASFRSRFAHDRDMLLARGSRPAPVVTDADLALLPPLMQGYLRRVGAVDARGCATSAWSSRRRCGAARRPHGCGPPRPSTSSSILRRASST